MRRDRDLQRWTDLAHNFTLFQALVTITMSPSDELIGHLGPSRMIEMVRRRCKLEKIQQAHWTAARAWKASLLSLPTYEIDKFNK